MNRPFDPGQLACPEYSVRIRAAAPHMSRASLLRAFRQADWVRDEGAATHQELPPPGRVLLFENLFADPDRPEDRRPRAGSPDMAVGTFQLASALWVEGVPVTLVRGQLSADLGFDNRERLLRSLEQDRPALVGITLLEGCFDTTAELVRMVAGASDAAIVLGGAMPTLAPAHVLAHMPGAHVAVRGAGEGILPQLARALARHPLDRTAEQAILELDGVLYERDGLLLAGHAGRVSDLDPDLTAMRFDLLQERHLAPGLSLETGRGCSHACRFCTTPGRGRYRGRSAEVVAGHLRSYRQRLAELYEEQPPRNALRIQINDDDFACDAARAVAVLRTVGELAADTGLELAPLQASVGDFLLREGGETRLDEVLLDAFDPALFQDAERFEALRDEPPAGLLPGDADCFVQLGVEAFEDGDLRRLGKGYSAQDAVAVIDALDARGIVHKAYLILANRGTTLDSLATTLLTVARLKIQHPYTFFIRPQVVPFVVPIFPSASYRGWARQVARGEAVGSVEVSQVRHIEGYEEFDYPVVERDLPGDVDVLEACENWESIMETDAQYVGPAQNLERWLRERLPAMEDGARGRVRRTIRRLAGARERLLLGGAVRARRGELRQPVAQRYWDAVEQLGPAQQVARQVSNLMDVGDPRLVVIPTRDCSLRCSYCPSVKQAGMEMSQAVFEGAVELLLSSSSQRPILQFFGGEALLRREFVLGGMERALALATGAGKQLGFILSTNGMALDEQTLALLEERPVKIEISLDGTRDVQMTHRRPRDPAADSYDAVARIAPALTASNIPHEVIMVVTPWTVDRLSASFAHVVSLGFRRIQINYGLAVNWERADKERFAAELGAIEKQFYAHDLPRDLELINLRTYRDPMLLNGEITVDHDGTVYNGNGFLIRTADAGWFRAGHLDDLANFDTYQANRPDNGALVEHTYPAEMSANSLSVGRIYGSFVKHMRGRFPELGEVQPTRAPGTADPTYR